MATLTTPNVIFPWLEKYSVGMADIDTQHKGLIRLINDLHAAMGAGQGKLVIGKILDDLVRYTEVHFRYEEEVMKLKRYSQFASHVAVHKTLTGQVIDLHKKYLSGELMLTVEVMQFLRNWLAGHIMGHDQQYAAEYKTK